MELRHCGIEEFEDVRPVLSAIYSQVHDGDDPFRTVQRFEDRLAGHASGDGWHAVIAYDDDRPAGFVYGAPLDRNTRWWSATTTPLPEGYTDEDGTRTLAVFELMLVRDYRGRGWSQALHEALLADRVEKRATLLVDPSHPSVVDLYQAWGYERVGDIQPFADSPVFAMMTRELP